jgi:hypothetical protein
MCSSTRIDSITLQVDAKGRIEDVDPTGAEVWEADFGTNFQKSKLNSGFM